jgi:hypothetical protein
VSSLVYHANRFDADVALVKTAGGGVRKIIAATNRALNRHEQGVRHQNIYWEEYLKQRQRRMVRQRATRLCKLLLLSLTRFLLASFRAFLSGAVWLLHFFSHRALTRFSSFSESASTHDEGMFATSWARLKTPAVYLPITALSLVTVGMALTAKPSTDVELVVPILAEAGGSKTSASAVEGDALHQAAPASISLPNVASSLAGASLSSLSVPEDLPESATYNADTNLLPLKTNPNHETTNSTGDLMLTDVTEPRPQPDTGATSSILPTTAAAPRQVVEAAPAMLRPAADQPETTSEARELQQTSSTNRDQRRNFVPHGNW